MWVGMLGKIKQNRSKFFDKDGTVIDSNTPIVTSSTIVAKPNTKKTTNNNTKPQLPSNSLRSQTNRAKWRNAFKQITKAVKVVSTMQNVVKRKEIKGEVEPSPLLVVMSELSRRATYSTQRNGASNVFKSERMKRPGHADHAPVLMKEGGKIKRTPQMPQTQTPQTPQTPKKLFQFSTDILGHAFRVAAMPVLTKKPEERTHAEIHAVAHIMRSLHFFTVLEDDSLNYLLVNATLRNLVPGEVLYKRGDSPDSPVYVILMGTLSVVVRHMGLAFTAVDLFSGTSVGEQAVASGNNQKNDVMASTAALLLALPRYPELLAQKLKESLQVKIRFLESITLLNEVTTSETRHLLAENLSVVRVKDNTAVSKEGTPITHLYLIKSGHLRTLKCIKPGRGGRNLLVEVQTLHPGCFFGENAFRHIPLNTLRSLRSAKKQKKNSQTSEHFGNYLASLVSTTYCELYELPILIAHAILSKEALKTLMVYGAEREQIYEHQTLSKELKDTIKANKFRKAALTSQTSLSTGSNSALTNNMGFT